jgi:hypothetical protein
LPPPGHAAPRRILGPRNRSSADGVYQSDTEQLLLDSGRKRLSVITPRTEAVVFDQPEAIALQQLRIEQADGPALVAASAMDGQPLAASGRILLIHGHRRPQHRHALQRRRRNHAGREPAPSRCCCRPAACELRLEQQPRPARRRCTRSTCAASAATRLRSSATPAASASRLDTGALSQGPTTYFEITSKD